MNYRDLYFSLISRFLLGSMSREEIAAVVADQVPIDVAYDERERELLTNCEWAIRHATEADFYTTEKEFVYYESCLRGAEVFSAANRDGRL